MFRVSLKNPDNMASNKGDLTKTSFILGTPPN